MLYFQILKLEMAARFRECLLIAPSTRNYAGNKYTENIKEFPSFSLRDSIWKNEPLQYLKYFALASVVQATPISSLR
jgi:hypothetical protein